MQHDEAVGEAWGAELSPWICENCDWVFFSPDADQTQRCPHCYAAALAQLSGGLDELAYKHAPERLLPFTLQDVDIADRVRRFARGIPFPPADLNPPSLRERFQRVFIPMWLVDTRVNARWEAEVGFDYQVVSHRDRYDEDRGGWISAEVEETRVRWESRLGRLDRAYENVPAPALEAHADLQPALGNFDSTSAQPYQAGAISDSWVRLPDRRPTDAWPDVIPTLRDRALEECREAAGADHLRGFRWTPTYQAQHWTQLLLPIYTSYYRDDEGEAQAVTIHGRTGHVSGPRRGSMKRAQRVSLIMLLAALAIGFLSLLAMILPGLNVALMPLGILGLVVSILLGLSSVIPIASVWRFNRGPKRA